MCQCYPIDLFRIFNNFIWSKQDLFFMCFLLHTQSTFWNPSKHDRYEPTIILLMGMWISLTKNPMNPIMANPIAVAIAIFWNSIKQTKLLFRNVQ